MCATEEKPSARKKREKGKEEAVALPSPSFDDLEALACGEMGLDIEYFYTLTPRQFDNIARGFLKKQDRQTREAWERTRYIMYTAALPNMPKKNKGMTVQQFMPFPWEKTQEAEGKKMSKQELRELFEKWDKIEFKKQDTQHGFTGTN